METKLIFFDIDGTLLHEKTMTISPSTIKAIQLAQNNGHQCFINTGRPISTIDPLIKNLSFDGYICGCGTYIQYRNKEILHAKLPQSLRQTVIQKSFEYHIDTVLEGKNAVYFPSWLHHSYVKNMKENYQSQGFMIHEYSQNDTVMFDKFASWYNDASNIDAFKACLQPYFDIIQRDSHFIEVVPLPYSKATGIQYIVDYLGSSIEHTISIGDSTNDLSMLTYTHESVAMGNSNPLLFDKVTYITTDIDHDGIYNALSHFHIIE